MTLETIAPLAAPGPPPSAPKRPRSPWGKVLLFFGIGCGGLLALVLVLIGLLITWAIRPGDQVPPDWVVGPEPVGLARIGSLAEDPGVSGALEQLAQELGRIQEERSAEETPEWVRRFQGRSQGPPKWIFTVFLPSEATLVLEHLPGDPELHLILAVNFRRFVRPVAFVLERSAHEGSYDTFRHGDHDVLGHRDEAWFCFVGGTLVIADKDDAMRVALDRIDERARIPDGSVALPIDLPQAQEGWDAAGLFLEGRESLASAFELVDAEDLGDAALETFLHEDFEQVSLGVDWETPDRIRGRATIDATDELSCETWFEDLDAKLRDLAGSAAERGLVLTHDLTLRGRRITVDLAVDGMSAFLARMARNH